MSILSSDYAIGYTGNPHARPSAEIGSRQLVVLNEKGFANAFREIASWTGYAPTPLHELAGLARAAGVKRIWYKDEAGRFGLGSFKALGGAYAVLRLLINELERQGHPGASARDLLVGRFRDEVREMTVTCATDGNHGRSVAWGAQLFGCRAVIYIHATVSEGRRDAIAQYGAEVVRVAGNYDDAVRQAARDAAAEGRFVVSDTSYPGYTEVPRDVMQGYTVMVEEVLRQLPQEILPTHVFVQGGVGGLAAAVCAHFWLRCGRERPRLVVVEPDQAACLFESARHGKPTVVEGELDTVMAGLACGEVSLLAWEILDEGADAFLTIPDAAALDCMRLLADGVGEDRPLVAGESAVAGLAGLLLACASAETASLLGLGPESRILVFGSEGDTDPELYTRIVGRNAEAVRRAT